MTNQQRFALVAQGDPSIDRCPVLEWATWWEDTLEFWEQQGLEKNLSSTQLFDCFGLDHNLQFWFPHQTKDCPLPKCHGAPLVQNIPEYKAFKKFIYPKDAVERLCQQITQAQPQNQNGSALIWFTLEGFFWFPRSLLGIEGHLLSFYDHPELYHMICEDLLEWQLKILEKITSLLNPDFMTIAEDMSYNLGPMLSEQTFQEFIEPYYRRLIPEIKKKGIRVLIDTDGDLSKMVPWLIRSGADGALPLERQAGVDLQRLQKEHPNFLWLGGFDKMCLLKGKDAIDNEICRILPMLRKGRFIPSVDHQTPPGTTLENYRYYVERLRQVSTQACKDSPSGKNELLTSLI